MSLMGHIWTAFMTHLWSFYILFESVKLQKSGQHVEREKKSLTGLEQHDIIDDRISLSK